MYLRLPMMKKWEDFLIFVGEIRKALALDDQEKDRAFNRPPTITEAEFHELRTLPLLDDDQPDTRWDELTEKWIDWNETVFHGNDDDWSLNVGLDATLDYDKHLDRLSLEWSEDWEAQNIVPLMARLLLIVPHDMVVHYSHLLVSKAMEIPERGGPVTLVVDFECSGREVKGEFVTYALKTASLYNAAVRRPRHKPVLSKETVAS